MFTSIIELVFNKSPRENWIDVSSSYPLCIKSQLIVDQLTAVDYLISSIYVFLPTQN